MNDLSDADSGPNDQLNFPILSSVKTNGTSLFLEGWSRPGASIEVFLTDVNEGTATTGDNQLGNSTDYGEGQIYLATLIEGSASDQYSATSSYLDADGNTDNTNRFRFVLAISGLNIGAEITTTATLGNSTSEFSPISNLQVFTVITNRKITYRVNSN